MTGIGAELRRASLALLFAAARRRVGQRRRQAPIYSCIDAHGKRITSDRPIPECAAREQRVLNADGSVNAHRCRRP